MGQNVSLWARGVHHNFRAVRARERQGQLMIGLGLFNFCPMPLAGVHVTTLVPPEGSFPVSLKWCGSSPGQIVASTL